MTKYNNFLNQDVVVTQIKSAAKLGNRQRSSLFGLGLKKIGDSVSLNCNPSLLGMIKSAGHLLKISKID